MDHEDSGFARKFKWLERAIAREGKPLDRPIEEKVWPVCRCGHRHYVGPMTDGGCPLCSCRKERLE